MTVEQMIEELQRFDPREEVIIRMRPPDGCLSAIDCRDVRLPRSILRTKNGLPVQFEVWL